MLVNVCHHTTQATPADGVGAEPVMPANRFCAELAQWLQLMTLKFLGNETRKSEAIPESVGHTECWLQ